MGLDITAYRQLKPAPDGVAVDDSGYPDDYKTYVLIRASTLEYSEEHFPGRSEGVIPGLFAFDEALPFRAGSYGGYNMWRAQLAELGGITKEGGLDEGKPFAELVWFSDCEGIIGPIVGAKLLKDFQDHLPQAEARGGYFLESYKNWLKAFELAADGGAVDFH